MISDLEHLRKLVAQKSNLLDISQFHNQVNIIFHDIEAKYYDQIHAEMWESLQPIYNSVINSILLDSEKSLKVLDIGCGTGLSTQMLLNTSISKSIESVTLLDTSSKMLEKSKSRFKNQQIEFNYVEGDIYSLAEHKFDLILISSVLHHIPDLDLFFKSVDDKLSVNGLLFHIHDPNGDAIKSELYLKRVQQLNEYNLANNKKISTRIVKKIKRIMPKPAEPDYIGEVNEILLSANVIHTPLTAQEIWSVTDIHVEDLPYSTNSGISVNKLGKLLNNYKIEAVKSYSFYGIMPSKLPKKYKSLEDGLFKANDLNGRNISCIWRKLV